jgi:hypothetical protein
MVGGSEAAFDRVKPLFELMGKNITLVGGNGDGQTTKVANQIIVALNIEAVGEALLFAAKAGADPAKVRQALMGGFANSRILEVHGERMIKRTFNPGFRIELHQKDLNLALAGARARRVAAQHRHRAGAVQRLRRARRRRLGPLGHGARAGEDGELRDRLGLIGSRSKWATFRHRLEARGFAADEIARITCPIGVPGVVGKEPEVIAAAVAAQLMQLR